MYIIERRTETVLEKNVKGNYFLATMPLYTRPRIVVVVVGVGVGHFIFTRKRLRGISSNFAYVFIVLLINYSQSVNWIEILVWDIFGFFAFEFVDLAAKRTSSENQVTYACCRWEIICLYERTIPILHFYQGKFSIFFFIFYRCISTLYLSFCGLNRKTDSYRGDFKWESNHVDIL